MTDSAMGYGKQGQPRSRLGNVLLVIAFSVLAVLSAELALWFLYPQTTLFPRYTDSPDYPIAFPENAELVHSQGSRWKFVYNTNELGRRGPYLQMHGEYKTTNVVALGDSFTFGIGVNDNEVYTSIMSKRLEGGYAVVNGGMGGWGIDSEIKWYFRTGSQYQPKYVVLQFTANDPGESFTGITKIENGEFAFYPITVTKPSWQLFLSRSRIIQTSQLYGLLRHAYDRYTAQDPFAAQRDSPPKVSALETKLDRAQANYAEMLRLFAGKLHDQDVELIFLSVTHGHKEANAYHYDLDHVPHIAQEVKRLEAEGMLHFLDLNLVEMSKYPGSAEGHQWSAAHHRLVGEDIARTIRALGESADKSKRRNHSR